MGKKAYIIVAIVAVAIFLGIICIRNYKVYYLPKHIEGVKRELRAENNRKECFKIQTSITREELLKRMAAPIETRKTGEGIIYVFEAPILAATARIQVLVDEKTDMVIGTQYSDSKWKYFTSPAPKVRE